MNTIKKKSAFSRLPIQQKRLVVLNDALKLILSKKLIADNGLVFKGSIEANPKAQLRPVLRKLLKTSSCTVCARGALLCSVVLKDNSFKVGDLERKGTFQDGDSIAKSKTDKRLIKLWPTKTKQIALMETAFERRYNHYFLGNEMYSAAVLFGSPFDNPENRLIAILKNAIANGGLFKP